MRVSGDADQFWIAAETIQRSLVALGDENLIRQFARLLDDLPADLFEVEFMPASNADVIIGHCLVRPGARLEAIAAALRAGDINGLAGHIGSLDCQ